MGEKKSGLREGDKRRRPEEGRDKRGKGSEQEMEKEEMRGAIAARKHSLTDLPETNHRHSPKIHSLLLPNIVHDSNDLQCQHILTKVWTKTKGTQIRSVRCGNGELPLKAKVTHTLWIHE